MTIRNISNQFSLSNRGNSSNDDQENRKQLKSSIVKSTVSEYAKKSTIHGVSYIADEERHKFERMWWFIMLVCSIIGAVYLIYQAYRTMKDNPIIQSPALNPSLVWEIPFPAITICPVVNDKFTDFALNKSNWPESARNSVPDNLTEIAKLVPFSASLFLESLLLQKSDQDHYDIIKQALPEINIISSLWVAPPVETPFAMTKTITHAGACLTFNMYKASELYRDGVTLSSHDDAPDEMEPLWSRDDGFKKGIENYTYPYRFFDIFESFEVAFDVNQSARFSPFDSISVFLHAPDDTPVENRLCTTVELDSGKVNNIEITARLIVSEGLEKYEPKVRQCYYTSERHLKYYKIYTQSHCEFECTTNFTLAQCGCVPYNMPHFNDTRICGDPEHLKCTVGAARGLFKPRFSDEGDDIPALSDVCDCLPTCTQLLYEYHLTTLSSDKTNQTTLYANYKRPFIEKYVRSELHSISEFFSNCGGSLGLLLGVSIFSIIELVYFCTVRLYLHSKSVDRQKSTENVIE